MKPGVVVKIGGSILREAEDYVRASQKIKELYIEAGERVAVVVSAAKGVTDKLLNATEGDRESAVQVAEQYLSMARELGGPRLVERIREELRLLEVIPRGSLSRNLKPRILALGEAVSRALMTSALEHVGIHAVEVPAVSVIMARGDPLNATVDYHVTGAMLRLILAPMLEKGLTPVIEGFTASSPNGGVYVLGRGGSDYTVTTIAALTGARLAHLVTDVPGILSGDPRYTPNPRLVKAMGYIEALEASRYGSKKLHPRTFDPIARIRRLSVRIGTWDSWTLVCEERLLEPPRVKLVASRRLGRSHLVALVGPGASRPGVVAKAVALADERGVGYRYMYTSPTGASLVFATDPSQAVELARLLHGLVEV